MGRIHFFEIQDQPWCPQFIRDGITDFLQFHLNRGQRYESIVPLLRTALERIESNRIIDLCSGAGGPWPALLPKLSESRSLTVCLTDKYPNRKAFEQIQRGFGDAVQFCPDSIDVINVPNHTRGFRTLFTALHHFKQEQAQSIINDAVIKRQGIGIFEFTHRSVRGIAFMCLAPLGMLLFAPFVRPFRWSRLIFTYLVPLLPFALMFDGVVSCLRTYSPAELAALIGERGGSDFVWDIGEGRAAHSFLPVTYLIGYPREKNKNN